MSKTETLDERSARVAAESAEVRVAFAERAQAEAERLAAAQRKADEEAVAAWNPRELDAAVLATRRAVNEVVEAMPLVQALADHLASQTRRRLLWGEHLAALGRMGQQTEGAHLPPVADMVNPQSLIASAAERIAHDRIETKETP